MGSGRGALVIACGALAREIAALRRVNGWSELDVCYLPPELHNRPERIAKAVQQQIRAQRENYQNIFVAYGDCGTGGGLDAMLRAEGVERTAMSSLPPRASSPRSQMPSPARFISRISWCGISTDS
jgi:hypothetical protein